MTATHLPHGEVVLHKIPPTAVGGLFKSFLYQPATTRDKSRQRKLADRSSPTFSSSKINSKDLNDPPTAVSGIKTFALEVVYRKDLNDPPTSVGGISVVKDLNDPPTAVSGIKTFALEVVYRKDLNDPPTSVGGIRTWLCFRYRSVEKRWTTSRPVMVE